MSRKETILFVDDEPRLLGGLKRMLSGYDRTWNMHYALSVDQAVQCVRQEKVDLVISDVNMPGKSGFDLLDILKNETNTANIPVIMLTGADDKDLKRQALDKGAADLLNKPVILEDMVARIRSALRLKSQQDQLKNWNLSLERTVQERTAELRISRIEAICRLAKAAEFCDDETGLHTLRVGRFAMILAREMGLDDEIAQTILLAAPLHDIGKIGVPDAILLKPAQLRPEEHKLMEKHCVFGSNILLQNPAGLREFLNENDNVEFETKTHSRLFIVAAEIAKAHHEQWNGNGYPYGLSGNSIPLSARIVALADTYDALGSPRPYRPAFSEERTFEIIRENVGIRFDPEVFWAFKSAIGRLRSAKNSLIDQYTVAEPVPT